MQTVAIIVRGSVFRLRTHQTIRTKCDLSAITRYESHLIHVGQNSCIVYCVIIKETVLKI